LGFSSKRNHIIDNLDSARVLSGGHNIHEYEHGGSDYGSGDFDGIRDYDLGENDYGHNPFESSDGDIDGDFDDYFGDGGDNGDNGDNGGCGGGCDGGCGRRHPRIPHRVGRVGGGCR
jgi:hypothetical protein